MTDLETADGFGTFFRSYTKTWIHAVATAGLTAFGTLTFVHRWFAVLAIGSYLVPPIALYVRRERARADGEEPTSSDGTAGEPTDERQPERTSDRTSNATDGDANASADVESATGSRSETPTDFASETESDGARDGRGETDRSGATERARSGPEDDGAENEAPPEGWHRVDVPTDSSLSDAVVTAANEAYAVGTGGTVVSSSASRDTDSDSNEAEASEWTVVLEDGPAARSNDLTGVDATADGGAVWVAGDSGALGRIDAETGRHTDYTAPADVTDNWTGVAVAGPSGDELVLLSNGSGQLLRGSYDGADGTLEWTDPAKPGSGSSLSGVDLVDPSIGYCCDTNDGVFEIADGGESFERVGLDGADGTLVDVAALERDACLVAADDGVVHRYDGTTWTPDRVSGELTGIAIAGNENENRAIACAGDGSIHERATDPPFDWERAFEADRPLRGASVGVTRAIAVGDGGTLLERRYGAR